MESLYLLIPLSAGLVLLIIAVFGWAVHGGQFEELEREGERILLQDAPQAQDASALDGDQGLAGTARQESAVPPAITSAVPPAITPAVTSAITSTATP